MKRVAIGAVATLLVAAVAYLAFRGRPGVTSGTGPATGTNPPPTGTNGPPSGATNPSAEKVLRFDAVEFAGPGGKQVVRPREHGFSLPAPANLQGNVVLTGTSTTGPASTQVRLLEYDPSDRTTTPVCDLPVAPAAGTGFRVEIPHAKLQRGHVYRLELFSAGSNDRELYGFNVQNQ